MDDALDRCGTSGAFHWLLLLYTGMSWACDAMEVMILSYLGPSARCEWGLTAAQESTLTSMVFLGMTLGAPVWGMVSDTWGRKTSFGLATLFATVFGFATAAAPNFAAMAVFRTLVGFGIPGAVVAFNLLLELTPTRLRGMFAVGIEGFWTIGTILQAGFAFGLLNKYGWRLLVVVSTIPYVVLLLLLPLVPESPRYLLVKGKTEQAQAVLKKVMRVSRADMPEGQLQPLLAGDDSSCKVAEDEPQGCGWLLRKLAAAAGNVWLALKQMLGPRLWMTTLTLVFTWMVAAFVYYGLVTLLTHVDFVKGASKQCINGKLVLPREDLVGILITSSAEVPGLLFSLVIVACLGRKLAFALPMVAIAVVLVPLMAGATGPVVGGIQVGVVVCMYLSRFFIYSSFNILWAMTPEYYPTSIRNFGLGVNNAFSRIGGLLSPFAAVNARQDAAWHAAPEAIFAALSLVAGASVLLLPPDKKGKALDDCIEDVAEVPELQRRVSSLVHSRAGNSGSSSWQQGAAAGAGQQQQQQRAAGGAAGVGGVAADEQPQLTEQGSEQALLQRIM